MVTSILMQHYDATLCKYLKRKTYKFIARIALWKAPLSMFLPSAKLWDIYLVSNF